MTTFTTAHSTAKPYIIILLSLQVLHASYYFPPKYNLKSLNIYNYYKIIIIIIIR